MAAAPNSTPSTTPMMTACSAIASASSWRPAPKARATEDAMPPPMPPADIVCISITRGKTSAAPAKASTPSRPT